jgi:hypothetical protein
MCFRLSIWESRMGIDYRSPVALCLRRLRWVSVVGVKVAQCYNSV